MSPSAISKAHGLSVGDLVLVAPGSIPTTTSGKIRRAACAEQYRQDEFTRLDAGGGVRSDAVQPGSAGRCAKPMKRLLAFGHCADHPGCGGLFRPRDRGSRRPRPSVPPTPAHPGDAPQPMGTPGKGYALGGAHVLGIPYDEYIMRTGADWFPGLDRQIVDYPAGQVQGHVLERLFPGIGRLDDNLPGLGMDGPSIGESVDVGDAQSWNAIHRGGPGTVIGLVRGRDGAQRRAGQARQRSDRAPAGQLSFAMYGDPVARHAFGRELPDPDVPRRQRRALARLPHPAAGGQPVRHLRIRLGLRQHRRLAGPAGQLDVARQRGRRVSRPVTPRSPSPSPAWCRRRTSERPSTPGARRRRRILIPEQHLPLVLPFKYLGVDEGTLKKLDGVLKPIVDAGYSRNDDPLTAPITVDPVQRL